MSKPGPGSLEISLRDDAAPAMGHKVETGGPYSIGSVQAVLAWPYGARMAGSDYAVGY
jgi:hypothetical protein